jgi:hypothetical protein
LNGAEILVLVYRALPPEEQEAAFNQLAELRRDAPAGEETLRDWHIRSMRRVSQMHEQEHPGEDLTAAAFRATHRRLTEAGEHVASIQQLIRALGTYKRARQALARAEDGESPARIHARIRHRRTEKPWRYTDKVLIETVRAASLALSGGERAPNVAAFLWWRERELEKAYAEGRYSVHIPTPVPYRRRFGGTERTWEAAMLGVGFTREQVDARHEQA